MEDWIDRPHLAKPDRSTHLYFDETYDYWTLDDREFDPAHDKRRYHGGFAVGMGRFTDAAVNGEAMWWTK